MKSKASSTSANKRRSATMKRKWKAHKKAGHPGRLVKTNGHGNGGDKHPDTSLLKIAGTVTGRLQPADGDLVVEARRPTEFERGYEEGYNRAKQETDVLTKAARDRSDEVELRNLRDFRDVVTRLVTRLD